MFGGQYWEADWKVVGKFYLRFVDLFFKLLYIHFTFVGSFRVCFGRFVGSVSEGFLEESNLK